MLVEDGVGRGIIARNDKNSNFIKTKSELYAVGLGLQRIPE